ncbi:hypothetical protein LOTGIDRAFT_157192 [Lottia gigantea]|uniref:Retropepsins domain-containing protein n=1 Tax=Lottia gigantea TaxID=225164 RepID=V4B3S8_LOTGI|nr:hypothetical protein LOTGIDRAFT_157192 [Lottia gigantea]ESP02051.1 hypothetical protein LOTGIDRAFT_157192 [Lottia gigantea]
MKKVLEVRNNADSRCFQDEENFAIDMISKTSQENEWVIPMIVEDLLIPFKIDTGAQTNCLPFKDFKAMQKSKSIKISNSKVNLGSCNSMPIENCGRCVLNVEFKGKHYKIGFTIVTNKHAQPIIGCDFKIKNGTPNENRVPLTNTTLENNFLVFEAGSNPIETIKHPGEFDTMLKTVLYPKDFHSVSGWIPDVGDGSVLKEPVRNDAD